MSARTPLICALALASATASASPSAPALDASTGALDADLAAALDSAASIAHAKPADAIDAILVLAASTDRFTVAQRALWSTRAAAVLVDAAAAASAGGDLALAARALDAAATLDPARKTDAARALLAWARADKSLDAQHRLGVVRRALALDPNNNDVVDEDDSLSRNWLFIPGAAIMLAGVGWQVGTIAAPIVVAQSGGTLPIPEDSVGFALIGSLLVGSALIGTGALIGFSGVPDPPVLPDALPALE